MTLKRLYCRFRAIFYGSRWPWYAPGHTPGGGDPLPLHGDTCSTCGETLELFVNKCPCGLDYPGRGGWHRVCLLTGDQDGHVLWSIKR